MSASEDIALLRKAIKDHSEKKVTIGLQGDGETRLLAALARLEQRVDAGDPGEGVRQKPDVVEEGVCHCGTQVAPRDPDPWEGRMDDFCEPCAWNRCDCYPDVCPVRYPAPTSTTDGLGPSPVPGSPDLASLVSSLTRERDEALGIRDGHISAVQKVLQERRRAEAAEAQVAVYRQAIERADSELALTELPCECDEGAECYCLPYDSRGQITKARQCLAAVVVGQQPDEKHPCMRCGSEEWTDVDYSGCSDCRVVVEQPGEKS